MITSVPPPGMLNARPTRCGPLTSIPSRLTSLTSTRNAASGNPRLGLKARSICACSGDRFPEVVVNTPLGPADNPLADMESAFRDVV